MDSTFDIQPAKKRKADEAVEDEETLSKKERKRLRKLAKEKAVGVGTDVATVVGSEVLVKTEEKKRRRKKEEKAALTEKEEAEGTNKEKTTEKKRQRRQNKALLDYTPEYATPPTSIQPTAETTPVPTGPSSSEISTFLTENRISIHMPDGEDIISPVLTFNQLLVQSPLRDALLSQGFKKPTLIQSCSWPVLLKGKDIIGIAETGSGKTLAFGLPALSKLLAEDSAPSKGKSKHVKVLVVAPTRELAIQTYETLEAIGRPWGIGCVCLYGGVDKGPQRQALQGKDGKSGSSRIVVGTPGRILDLLEEGCLDLQRVTYVVLDEADRMLDRGFENDIQRIIARTVDSSMRQTVMFSATWPESVRRLASSLQRKPVRVTVGSEDLAANGRVEQVVEVLDSEREKDPRLLDHLRRLLPKHDKSGTSRVLVFALYKAEASRLTQTLQRAGYDVSSLHGDLNQNQRMAALEEFKLGKKRLMVATDVAARGLDIPEVEMVINYTFPLTVEDYVHRIGRTGRGGRSGKSVTFFTGEKHERSLAGELAKVLRESGFSCEGLKRFPMTIKKKEHSAYGAFYKATEGAPLVGKKIRF